MPPIRLAVIGAGRFARDVHAPTLQKLAESFQVKAIYSRTNESAAALATQFLNAEVTTDLDTLLTRADIDAVDIVLPIGAMPTVIEQALKAGKHIISEKPLAPDVATGKFLLSQKTDKVWMVAENWRFEARIMKAAEILLAGTLGRPLTAFWALHTAMNPTNIYYQTDWRRNNSFPGGFLVDGGIHHVAAMRFVLGEIKQVSAFMRQNRPDLPPADTLSASIEFENGILGTYLCTYAVGSPWPAGLHIVCEEGALLIQPKALHITHKGETQTLQYEFNGVEAELRAFAAAVLDGQTHHNTPEEALRDLVVIEAMLESARTGQRITIADYVRE